MEQNKEQSDNRPGRSLLGLLKPYSALIAALILLALFANGLTLSVPMIISSGIDGFLRGSASLKLIITQFFLVSALIFVFTYLQSIVQTYASEKVARDLRRDLSERISSHSYFSVQKITPAKLLTNLTSDIDSVKMFVAQAIATLISSIFIIIGASFLLLSINWQLGLAVLVIIPIIGGTFFFVLSRVRALFLKTRQIIDRLNKIINESILGAALIRILNSEQPEYEKFMAANTGAKDLGLRILRLFAGMIPVIMLASNLAVLIILILGGHFVIIGSMSLGNFAAFYSYLAILIFPILVIGFMSNVIAQAQASYGRVVEVLNAPEEKHEGALKSQLSGAISIKDINLMYEEKPALKKVTLAIKPGTKTAIIGPTVAGKTQLLYLLIGLIEPDSGSIEYDNKNIRAYEEEALHKQIGLVFQDSIIFNMSLRENIAFNAEVEEGGLEKAIRAAELEDFINSLPEELETIVSERGGSLSGGQKQRIMLARALSLNPKILLLDDFTARVDAETERKILKNIADSYPGLTLVSVTQKIAAIKDYEQIILLMEGEVIASGRHEQLLETSPEYAQIYNSQKSTNAYELQPE